MQKKRIPLSTPLGNYNNNDTKILGSCVCPEKSKSALPNSSFMLFMPNSNQPCFMKQVCGFSDEPFMAVPS